MKFKYLGVLCAAVPALLACSFDGTEGPGGSGGASAGAGGGGQEQPGLDPEQAAEPSLAVEDPGPGQPLSVDLSEDEAADAIEVSAGVYAALLDAADGDSLDALPDVAGMDAFVDAVSARLPVAGAPNAICAAVTIPVSSGCAAIAPELVDGGSYDPDYPSTGELPLEGLEAMVDQPEVCGLGTHPVALTVYDYDGSFSSCTAAVTLCDPATDAECPDEIVALTSDVKIAERPQAAFTCHWVRTASVSATAQTKLTLSNYSYQEQGPGPRYWRTSKDLEARSCLNPPDHQESFSESLGGDVDVNVNVICVDAAKNIVKDPKCQSDVEFRTFYTSQARAYSEDGLACGGNAVEAFAQDEASFAVNNQAVFGKAVVVQNGTEASTSVTFSLGGELGTSKDGVSANASVGFGWTRNFTDKTADKTDFLFADGYKKEATPVTARLQARGRTYLKVHDRTWGLSDVRTGHWLMVFLGSSACPGAHRFANARREHYTNVLVKEGKRDVTAANQFLKSRGFKLVIP